MEITLNSAILSGTERCDWCERCGVFHPKDGPHLLLDKVDDKLKDTDFMGLSDHKVQDRANAPTALSGGLIVE